jgi:N-acetylmuramoyl-L-alanine amidase
MEITKIEGRDCVSLDSIRRLHQFDKLSQSGSNITLIRTSGGKSKVQLKLKIGSNECLMNQVKFILSHPVSKMGEKIFVSHIDFEKLINPVLRPHFIRTAGSFQTVILDPGHGGKDPGATNAFGSEANYNLRLANLIKRNLESKGFRVLMTRNSDTFLSLQERVEFANRIQQSAIYISLHFNSGGSAARGIETFTLSPPGVSHYGRTIRSDDQVSQAGNHHDSANIALATAVHGSILHKLGRNTFDRGIKRARFSVLTGVRHPAILFEGGFMSHPLEARLIDKPVYQNALADSIVEAIRKYRVAVGGNSLARLR